MGIRINAVFFGVVMLIAAMLAVSSCNKPPQDTGAGATTSSASATKARTASAALPKLQEYGADW